MPTPTTAVASSTNQSEVAGGESAASMVTSEVPATTSTTAAPATASATPAANAAANVEINPEFLAALPPQIQEELLTQQRIEQQARAAAAQNATQGKRNEFYLMLIQNMENENTLYRKIYRKI